MATYKVSDYLSHEKRYKQDYNIQACFFQRVKNKQKQNSITDCLFDCHTEGLNQHGNGYELQIVLKVSKDTALTIINIIAEMIKAGVNIRNGDFVYFENKDGGFSVQIMENEDLKGRNILRIILPDNNGLFPEDEGCQSGFNLQGLTTKTIAFGLIH